MVKKRKGIEYYNNDHGMFEGTYLNDKRLSGIFYDDEANIKDELYISGKWKRI